MTSPEAMKANVQNGFPVAPRFSVSADPEAAATSPIVSVVDRLAKQNLLKAWPRPPVPEYLLLEAILGEEIHRALRGEVSDREALNSAQELGGSSDAGGRLLLSRHDRSRQGLPQTSEDFDGFSLSSRCHALLRPIALGRPPFAYRLP